MSNVTSRASAKKRSEEHQREYWYALRLGTCYHCSGTPQKQRGKGLFWAISKWDVTRPRHSSGGSGISLRERTGERKTQRNAKIPPTTAIAIASLRPKTSPSTPPARAPTGIVPHTIHLIVAFIRP